jgi:ATP-binding cassette subfamily B protein
MSTDRKLVQFFIAEARKHGLGFFVAFLMMPVCAVLAVSGPKVFQLAIDHGIIAGDAHYLTMASFGFLLIIVARTIMVPLQQIFVQTAGIRTLREIRGTIVRHVAHLGKREFEKRPVGVFVSRATSDVEAVGESLATGLMSIVTDVFTVIAVLVAVFTMDVQLGVVTLVLVPIVGAIINFFRLRVRHLYERVRTLNGQLAGQLNEAISMRYEILNFDLAGPTTREFAEVNKDFRETSVKSVSFDAGIYSVIDALSHLTLGVVLLMVARSWYFTDTLSVGQIAMYVLLLQQLFEPFRELGQRFTTIQATLAALNKISDVVSIPRPPDDGKQALAEHDLNVSNVVFSYLPGQPVLRDVSFQVPSGGSLAIVGPTGSGKTTIVRLLTRQYDVDAGQVRIGNVDLRDTPRSSLQGNIVLVPQEPTIFHATVSDNIGLERKGVSREEIESICEEITAHDFIRRLPRGYDTQLETGGTSLSMGQRQLIALARALVSGAQTLIFDESTANIDTQTELMIQRALDFVMAHRTTIVIAHRLSTIRDADNIIVLAEGKIVQQGNHTSLVGQAGLYRDMYELQSLD